MKDDILVLNNMRFAQRQRFYCNFQLIESHCVHTVSLIEINIPELPSKCHALRSYRGG